MRFFAYTQNDRHSESGNVFIFILLGIALFSALAFTVSRGMQGETTGKLTAQKADLAATDILNYAQQVSRAVDRVRRKGCSESQISFEKAPFDGSDTKYVNNDAPEDFSCHVFHASGGNLTPQDPPQIALDPAQDGVGFSYGEFIYTGLGAIEKIGRDCTNNSCNEILLYLPNLNLSVCEAINEKMDIASIDNDGLTNMDGLGGSDYFTGVFDYVNANTVMGAGLSFEGKNSACFMRSQSTPALGQHTFYSVLLAR